MKKVLLEQPKPKPGAKPTRVGQSTGETQTPPPASPDSSGGSSEAPAMDDRPQQSGTSVPPPAQSTGTPAAQTDVNSVAQKRDGLDFFNTFTFKDYEGKPYKFSDDDKGDILDLLPKFNSINNKKYDNDDAFVRAAIYFLLSKNKPVFSVTYLNTSDTKIQLDEKRNIGLGVLLEQMETTIYVAKGEGNNFMLTNNRQKAQLNRMATGSVKNAETPKPAAPTSTPPSTGDTKTPESKMSVEPKPEMVDKVAATQGDEGLKKVLSEPQWTFYNTYWDRGFTKDKPEDKMMSAYEVIDLKGEPNSPFTEEFKVYRIKKLDTSTLDVYAESLADQDVNKKSCREATKIYLDTALDRKTMSDATRKSMATFLVNCKSQFRDGFGDFKKTEKRLQTIENKLGGAQYCKYQINFTGNNQSRAFVGCADNLINLE
jgi:hypothetical protein